VFETFSYSLERYFGEYARFRGARKLLLGMHRVALSGIMLTVERVVNRWF
jgi:hypothetical protein